MGNLIHLALIMDGNGRWAEGRGLPRSAGHSAGSRAIARVAKGCINNGIRFLTLYCFSQDNWKRPKKEVDLLMGLFVTSLASNLSFFKDNSIKILHLGSKANLSPTLLSTLDRAISETRDCSALTIQLAINYSGQDEIARMANRAIESGYKTLTPTLLREFVDNPEVPDPDMICRSGPDKRLSGFLLYQSNYAELAFYDRLWPDWDEKIIGEIVEDFSNRQRRFGDISRDEKHI